MKLSSYMKLLKPNVRQTDKTDMIWDKALYILFSVLVQSTVAPKKSDCYNVVHVLLTVIAEIRKDISSRTSSKLKLSVK